MPLPKGIADHFADLTWMPLQDWMLWKGWKGWVGCNVCAIPDDGDEPAPDKTVCWNKRECHGYHMGCGCIKCTKHDDGIYPQAKAEWYREKLVGHDPSDKRQP